RKLLVVENGDLHSRPKSTNARQSSVQKYAGRRRHLDRDRAGLLHNRELAVGVALLKAASIELVVVLDGTGLHVELGSDQFRAEEIRANGFGHQPSRQRGGGEERRAGEQRNDEPSFGHGLIVAANVRVRGRGCKTNVKRRL